MSMKWWAVVLILSVLLMGRALTGVQGMGAESGDRHGDVENHAGPHDGGSTDDQSLGY